MLGILKQDALGGTDGVCLLGQDWSEAWSVKDVVNSGLISQFGSVRAGHAVIVWCAALRRNDSDSECCHVL